VCVRAQSSVSVDQMTFTYSRGSSVKELCIFTNTADMNTAFLQVYQQLSVTLPSGMGFANDAWIAEGGHNKMSMY